MVTITAISNLNYGLYDEVWAIVRSLKYTNPNIKHVPELSPSWGLFKKYLNLRNKGQWNEETFRTVYVPQFLKEMRAPQCQKLLNKLANTKKNICLVCFCPEEELCHRSIIGGMLQGAGVEVNGLEKDYGHYYSWYKEGVPGISEKKDATKDEKKVSKYNTNVTYAYEQEIQLKEKKTLCFTGRRPKNLCWYDESKYRTFVDDLVKLLYEKFYTEQGVRRFISGGAQGFDQMAFWAVNKMKTVYKCEDVENVVFIPFEGQQARWAEKGLFSQAEYWMMIRNADKVVVVADNNSFDSLFERNHTMCDNAQMCLGLYADNSWRTEKGGTAECLRYARKCSLNTFLLRYWIDGKGLHIGKLANV